jgi:hypothetical protein
MRIDAGRFITPNIQTLSIDDWVFLFYGEEEVAVAAGTKRHETWCAAWSCLSLLNAADNLLRI